MSISSLFSHKSLKSKILIIIFSCFILFGTLLSIRNYYGVMETVTKDAEISLNQFERIFIRQLEVQKQDLSLAMELLLTNEKFVTFFADKDRKGVSEMFQEYYQNTLRKKLGIQQFQLHLPPATSFFSFS